MQSALSNFLSASLMVPLVKMFVLRAATVCWRALSSFTNELTNLLMFDILASVVRTKFDVMFAATAAAALAVFVVVVVFV